MHPIKQNGDNQLGMQKLKIFWVLFLGALKQGPCTCSTFKAFNLTYLHVLRTTHYVHRYIDGSCAVVIELYKC